MNKKFKYIDDNPGAYFEMLVENWENLNEDKKNLRNWIEKRVGKQMSSMKPTKIGYKHGRPYYSVDFVDGTSDDYFIDFDKKEIEKCESLKEDKFVPQDKMSKKAQKELNDKKRGTWGSTKPITRVQPNKKAYDRKRDKKANLDESKELKEDFDIKLNKYEKDSDIKDGYTFNFIVNGHPVSMSCWTEDLGDGKYGDFIVDFDDYSQLDFISEDELDDLWEKLGDVIETKVLKNESLKESKNKTYKIWFSDLDQVDDDYNKLDEKKFRVLLKKLMGSNCKLDSYVYENINGYAEAIFKSNSLKDLYNGALRVLGDSDDVIWNLAEDNDMSEEEIYSLLDINESLEESVLNESSDGWDESKLYDLSEILDEIYNLQYEVQNTVRGAYTNAHTYEELGYYVHNLGSNLMDVGDEIMEMEEEDEEDED